MVAFATAVSAYAQKQGSPKADENMLRYRYLDKESRKVSFTTPRTFAERIYLITDTNYEGLYEIGNHPKSPGYSIGSRLGLGGWITPIHGVEMSFSYGLMPYGYWTKNFVGNPIIENTIVNRAHLEASYVFNISNYSNRHDKPNKFEFLYTAGVNLGITGEFDYGVNTSFRAIYNLGSTAGLYLEPKVSVMNMEYLRPSIAAGFTFRFRTVDSGFDKPVDTEKKQLLMALKSNCLFWVAGAPNFSLEFPINKRWSINADYVAPWSSSFATGLYYQLMMVNAEARYWFGDRERRPQLTGWFAGASIGGGYYDFMLNNKKVGLQGEFYIMAGISAGYSHSISSNDRVRLEYALGMGYLKTSYRKYTWDYFDYVLVAPSEQVWSTSIFGPTQAKVSVVWLLFKDKKGGVR